MNIAAGIMATKAALEVAKMTMDKLNSGNVDVTAVRTNVQELLIHVVNAQVALGDANNEIVDLRRQLDDRDALKALEADLEMHKGGYFARKSEGSNILYCPVCWGADKKLVPLSPYKNPGRYYCVLHKIDFATPEFQPTPLKRPTFQMGRVERG
jgi:hypothetical protein